MIRSLPCPLCRHQPRFSTIFRRFRTLASAGEFCIRCLRYCCLCFAPPCRVWRISWKSGCGANIGSISCGVPYDRGLPAHDTLNDVINGLDAELFKTCFANWVETLRDRAPDIIAIDGKTSRRTHARRKGRVDKARRQNLRGGNPRPLGRRKPAALGSRRRLPRRSCPAPQPQRAAKHGRGQTHGHEPGAKSKRQAQPQGQAKTRQTIPTTSKR